jgi:hypothetical protein
MKPLMAGFLFALIVFLDLFLQGASFTQSKVNPAEQFAINPDLKQLLQAQPPKNIFRVKTRLYSPSYMAMKRNQGVLDKIYMLEGYNPLMLNVAQVPLNWTQLFEVMNIKYDLKIDSVQRNVVFYETPNPLGPAFFAQKARYIPLEKARDFMLNNEIDYSKEVVVHSNSINLSKYNSIDSNFTGKLNVSEYLSNSMKYEVNVSKPCIMVFSEIFYPKWKCKIDGKEVPVLQVNNSFRGVELANGKHSVEMYYSDSDFATGEIISLFSIALGVVLIIIFRNKK